LNPQTRGRALGGAPSATSHVARRHHIGRGLAAAGPRCRGAPRWPGSARAAASARQLDRCPAAKYGRRERSASDTAVSFRHTVAAASHLQRGEAGSECGGQRPWPQGQGRPRPQGAGGARGEGPRRRDELPSAAAASHAPRCRRARRARPRPARGSSRPVGDACAARLAAAPGARGRGPARARRGCQLSRRRQPVSRRAAADATVRGRRRRGRRGHVRPGAALHGGREAGGSRRRACAIRAADGRQVRGRGAHGMQG
jgi:hypothetical protein